MMIEKWFVLCTKPRNELKVLNRLISLGIDAYTPSRIELRQWSDRKKKVLVPLLPSMVLVRLDEKEVQKVFDIPGVVRYLFEHGTRAVVSNEEVQAMQMYLENIHTLNKQGLAEGDTVQVPLLDQEAILLSVKGKKCFAQLKKLGAIVSFQLS
jgi:transcription antitermination factor NusG